MITWVFPSPPSRWCGLKFFKGVQNHKYERVTTFAVVWIEIEMRQKELKKILVTTFAVVWIEIGL